MKPEDDAAQLLELFGIAHAGRLASHSPIDGAIIGRLAAGDPELACERAGAAFEEWRKVPAPIGASTH